MYALSLVITIVLECTLQKEGWRHQPLGFTISANYDDDDAEVGQRKAEEHQEQYHGFQDRLRDRRDQERLNLSSRIVDLTRCALSEVRSGLDGNNMQRNVSVPFERLGVT